MTHFYNILHKIFDLLGFIGYYFSVWGTSKTKLRKRRLKDFNNHLCIIEKHYRKLMFHVKLWTLKLRCFYKWSLNWHVNLYIIFPTSIKSTGEKKRKFQTFMTYISHAALIFGIKPRQQYSIRIISIVIYLQFKSIYIIK